MVPLHSVHRVRQPWCRKSGQLYGRGDGGGGSGGDDDRTIMVVVVMVVVVWPGHDTIQYWTGMIYELCKAKVNHA